jgi:hypothetical protein
MRYQANRRTGKNMANLNNKFIFYALSQEIERIILFTNGSTSGSTVQNSETVPPFIKQKCAMLMVEVIKFDHFATKKQYFDMHLKICQNIQ